MNAVYSTFFPITVETVDKRPYDVKQKDGF
jgi:hypothetical protein